MISISSFSHNAKYHSVYYYQTTDNFRKKTSTDDQVKLTQMTNFVIDIVENILGKGEEKMIVTSILSYPLFFESILSQGLYCDSTVTSYLDHAPYDTRKSFPFNLTVSQTSPGF